MAQMTHRERVLAALNHQETDRPPIDFGGTLATSIVPYAYDRLKKHLGEEHETVMGWHRQQLVLPHESILKRFDVDTRPLKLGDYVGGKARQLSAHTMIDNWGTTWNKEATGHYMAVAGGFFETEADSGLIESYDWLDPDNPGFYQGLKERAEALHNNTNYAVILDMGIGIVTRAQFVRGFMDFLMDMTNTPEFAVALLNRLGDIWVKIARNALKQVGHLVDVVFWGDDYGMQQAPMFRPRQFSDYVKPVNQRMVATVKEHTDAKILQHSCGCVYPMIEEMIEMGIDALNPIQVLAKNMQPKKLKAEFGDRLTFWGAIDTQDVLPFKTPAEVRENVRQVINTLGVNGGYVLATTHNLQDDVPPENIAAMFDACLSFNW